MLLTQEKDRLKDLRRGLRAQDQRRLDELFEFARRNLQAGVLSAAADPMESLLLLTLIEMLKRIETLEARLAERKEPE